MENRYAVLALMMIFQGLQGAAAPGAAACMPDAAPKKEAAAVAEEVKKAAGDDDIRVLIHNELGEDVGVSFKQAGTLKRYTNIDKDKIDELYLPSSGDNNYVIDVTRTETTRSLLGSSTRQTVVLTSTEKLTPHQTNSIKLYQTVSENSSIAPRKNLQRLDNTPYVPNNGKKDITWPVTNSTATKLLLKSGLAGYVNFMPNDHKAIVVNRYKDGWDKDIIIELHEVYSVSEADITTFIIPWDPRLRFAEITQPEGSEEFILRVSGEGLAAKEIKGISDIED